MQENRKKIYILGISIWFVCALLYAFEFFVRASPNALSDYFHHDLHIDPFAISLVGSAFYLFYVLAQLPAGLAVDRFGVKKVMIFATLVCFGGMVIFTAATDAWGLIFGRALVGFGGGFAFISTLKVVAQWLPERVFPSFAGLTNFMGYLGGVASGVPLVMLLNAYGETDVFIGVTAFAMFLLLMSIFWVRSNVPEENNISFETRVGILESLGYVLTNRQILLNGLYCLVITGTTAVFADLWGIDYLHAVHGFSRVNAAYCISFVYLGVAFSSPLWGMIASLSNGSKRWLVTASVTGFFIVIVLLYLPITLELAIILCFFFGSVQSVHVLNFHLVHKNARREQLGASIAVVNLFVPLSGFLFQPLSGAIIQFFDSHEATAIADEKGLAIVPALMLCAFVIALFFRERSSRSEV